MQILGLDVGSFAIKGTLLERHLLRRVVKRAFSRPLGSGPLAEQVAAALREEAPRADLVVLSIGSDLVRTRNVSLPFKDLKKVKLVVPGEAERAMPFPLRDALVRYLVTDETAVGQTHVLILAMKRADLDAVTGLVAGVKLHEVTAAVDSLAAVNAYLHENAPGSGAVVIDLGARKTAVEVLNGSQLMFSRTIAVAGAAFTQAIAARLKMALPDAEALKCALSGSDVDEATAAAAHGALADVYKRLARELKVSVLAARNTWPALRIEAVRVCGGSARAPGILEAISEAVGARAELLTARMLEPAGAAADPAMVASAGLALTGGRQAKVEVDFPAKPRDIVRFHRKEIVLVVGLLLALLLGSYGNSLRRLAALRAESEATEARISEGLKRLTEVNRAVVDAGNLEPTAAKFRKLKGVLSEDTASRLALINQISAMLPPGADITFRMLAIERSSVDLEGETDSFQTAMEVEEALKAGLKRPVEAQPPRRENREDRTVTVFQLKFSSQPGEGGGR